MSDPNPNPSPCDLAHTQRLMLWATFSQPSAYAGSDMMKEDIKATIAELERLAELVYRLSIAPQ